MSEIIETNVCIVGAGPAGSTASIMLGKMKIPHVVVDAAIFPRDKICGDGLDLKVVRVLNNIDPAIVENELSDTQLFTPSMGMRFILPEGRQVDLMCNGSSENPLFNKPLFYTARRTSFDEFLLNKIEKDYADLRPGFSVTNITKHKDQWRVEANSANKKIEIRSKLLIGADGDHSIVLKNVAERKINRKHYAAALRQYWQNVEGIDDNKLIEIYFPKKYPFAYFWIFPLTDNTANIGFGMASHHVAKTNINVKKALSEIIKTDKYISRRFTHAQALDEPKGWGIPMATLHRKAYGDGWLLTGDAASLVCPKSGEGIGPAMLSGFIAAHYIQRALREKNFSASMFSSYNREVHKRFAEEERLYRFANAMPPWLFIKGVDKVLSSKVFIRWYTEKEMKRWLVTAYEKRITISFD
jgi:geranylgeranyl reductase family protein